MKVKTFASPLKIFQARKELEELESEFDGMILIEQQGIRGQRGGGLSVDSDWEDNTERISNTPNASPGGGNSYGGGIGQGNTELGPPPEEAEPGGGPGVEKEGEMPDFEMGNMGDGSDDDVVARQLREAAETETDPLLKEELWKEYKKYKNSAR